jgi:rSAM/selenodomain-associated transferase 2
MATEFQLQAQTGRTETPPTPAGAAASAPAANNPSPAATGSISVVIPTLNEQDELPAALAHLTTGGDRPGEIIVADGGSRDGTVALARGFGCRVVPVSPSGRARQLNAGAAAAGGDIILFLHADTWLAPGALRALRESLAAPAVVGGAFARRFRSGSRLLQVSCRLADLRGAWLGWHLGDQAMFARRAAFARLGGFALIPVFEDLEFARRLKRLGRVVTLRPPVVSSGRRFAQRGPWRTTLSDAWLTCRYLAGAAPERLKPAAGPRTLP